MFTWDEKDVTHVRIQEEGYLVSKQSCIKNRWSASKGTILRLEVEIVLHLGECVLFYSR